MPVCACVRVCMYVHIRVTGSQSRRDIRDHLGEPSCLTEGEISLGQHPYRQTWKLDIYPACLTQLGNGSVRHD